jgi:hypothetical protein
MRRPPGFVPRSIPLLTFGHLADWLARALGWSPLDAVLRLHGVEGPRAARLEGRRVRVVAVEPAALRVEPIDPPHPADATLLPSLRLSGRHAGYPLHALRFLHIAVVITDANRPAADPDASIALATLDR